MDDMRSSLPSYALLNALEKIDAAKEGLIARKLQPLLEISRSPTMYSLLLRLVEREMITVRGMRRDRDGRPSRVYVSTEKGKQYAQLYREMLALEKKPVRR